MKYTALGIAAVMLLVSLAIGAITPTSNVVSQSNVADAYGSGCCGIIIQKECNAAIAIGESNLIDQTNTQSADSWGKFDINQESTNLALALGIGNGVTQTNIADAFGGRTTQKQLNAIVVLGGYNIVDQKNDAIADELRIGCGNKITQCQTNLGLIIGTDNGLNQLNDAYARIPKDCDKDPRISQIQDNMAVLISETGCQGNT